MKKLIEDSLPLKEINENSAKEKSIRHGHPSTMHLWWARRPLASARAVLFSMLVDAPEDPDQRDNLETILKRLSDWNNLNDKKLFDYAREEIRKIYGDDLPTVLDPFAGGGAIPLEAQRLGLPVVATDLNPVAILINRAMLEIPSKYRGQSPKHPQDKPAYDIDQDTWRGSLGLAEDVRYYGERLKDLAWQKLESIYPKIDGKTVVAWIWARTIRCPNPACRCEMPLVHSWKLSNDRFIHAEEIDGEIRYSIREGSADSEGTIDRKGARCVVCGDQIKLDVVRSEAREGRMGSRLIAIVANGSGGKEYLPPDSEHERIANVERIEDPFDEAELPEKALGFRVQGYGMKKWSDLYSNRQLKSLVTFSDLLDDVESEVIRDSGSEEYGRSIRVYLAILIDKLASYGSICCNWLAGIGTMQQVFGLQGIKMTWNYAEANPFSGATGCLESMLDQICRSIENFPDTNSPAETQLLDATQLANHFKDRRFMICTDPPYYDNVGFADLSDFFYVWLRRNLRTVYPDLFRRSLTPKQDEIIMNPARHGGDKNKSRDFFETRLKSVFENFYQVARDDLPLSIFYAFKQKEVTHGEENSGWETMLQSLIDARLQIIGTIPIKTERSARPRAIDSNALSTSIVLVCRKRLDNRSISRTEFRSELLSRLKTAVEVFQRSNLSPVDIAQAIIGPGMEIFSKYEEIYYGEDDEILTVRDALREIVDAYRALFDERSYDSATQFCFELYMMKRFDKISFGEVDLLARGKNVRLEDLSSMIHAESGEVWLKNRDELQIDKPEDSLWLQSQQLLQAMEKLSAPGCIDLMRQIPQSSWDSIKKLMYQLYQNSTPRDAVLYNSVIGAWDRITLEASQKPSEQLSMM